VIFNIEDRTRWEPFVTLDAVRPLRPPVRCACSPVHVQTQKRMRFFTPRPLAPPLRPDRCEELRETVERDLRAAYISKRSFRRFSAKTPFRDDVSDAMRKARLLCV
jgi:hypothetical protein